MIQHIIVALFERQMQRKILKTRSREYGWILSLSYILTDCEEYLKVAEQYYYCKLVYLYALLVK